MREIFIKLRKKYARNYFTIKEISEFIDDSKKEELFIRSFNSNVINSRVNLSNYTGTIIPEARKKITERKVYSMHNRDIIFVKNGKIAFRIVSRKNVNFPFRVIQYVDEGSTPRYVASNLSVCMKLLIFNINNF